MEKYTPKQESRLLTGGSQYEALEAAFTGRVLKVARDMNRIIHHHPKHLLHMVDEYGAVQAACKLAYKPTPSTTFALRLLRQNRLDLAMESLVIEPEWSLIIHPTVVEAAMYRLKQFGWLR